MNIELDETMQAIALILGGGDAQKGVRTALVSACAHKGAADSARKRAVEWLHSHLLNGPAQSANIFQAAAMAGISASTLIRAKRTLGVVSSRQSLAAGGRWYWTLGDKPGYSAVNVELRPIDGGWRGI